MFEAIFVLVTLAIVIVEIIEVRHKCEQFPAAISAGSRFGWGIATMTAESAE